MNISTVFLTLALMIISLNSVTSVQAMDIKTYENQALTSIRLELWYEGVNKELESASNASHKVKKHLELPEELTVALQKQLAH